MFNLFGFVKYSGSCSLGLFIDVRIDFSIIFLKYESLVNQI